MEELLDRDIALFFVRDNPVNETKEEALERIRIWESYKNAVLGTTEDELREIVRQNVLSGLSFRKSESELKQEIISKQKDVIERLEKAKRLRERLKIELITPKQFEEMFGKQDPNSTLIKPEKSEVRKIIEEFWKNHSREEEEEESEKKEN